LTSVALEALWFGDEATHRKSKLCIRTVDDSPKIDSEIELITLWKAFVFQNYFYTSPANMTIVFVRTVFFVSSAGQYC